MTWNNAGADVAWSQTSATAATNAATFAGADGDEGAYPISVTTGIATQTLSFSSTGYALSAAAARTITLTSNTLSVASGKSAAIGANVTASFSATTINANARLRVTTAATPSPLTSVTVNANGGFETNVGTYTIGQLEGLTNTDFEFTYQRRDDSVSPETTQTFEWGTTLAAWPGSAVVPATSGTVGGATITVSAGTPDDGVTDTVKISIPKTEAGAGGTLFGRLKVSQP